MLPHVQKIKTKYEKENRELQQSNKLSWSGTAADVSTTGMKVDTVCSLLAHTTISF